jgi:hypothetical protein
MISHDAQANSQGTKIHTAAYATATLENVTGVSHHVALVKPKTRKHPIKPIQAGQGCAHAKMVKGL